MLVLDSQGNSIQLGQLIGKGGEGNVYEVNGQSELVAKIYHQVPLTEEQFCKLDWMVARKTATISRVAAWPETILRQSGSNEPCGLLMPKVDGARQLHELYGTTNRRLHFPDVRWHHLLLAARNLAAAFHSLHEQGIVVGDVNQGNLMVNNHYNVRFIDCDSFQISDDKKIYGCPVGTPHFTPPELQAQKLSGITRTIDHDAFGLAVLIFHLVFVGRHPFAGRFRGEGDLLIEQAIAERRFAFSRDSEETLVEPPPYSLQMSDLPSGLTDLFETAFRLGGLNGTLRPSPAQWVKQLEALMAQRTVCDLDDLHIYYSGLKACPWCRIENEGGPSFFVKESGSSFVSDGRLALLDAKINALRPIPFPDLPPSLITPPQGVATKETGEKPKYHKPDLAALAMVAGAVLCVGGAFHGAAYVTGLVLVLASGGYLLLGPPCKARRMEILQFEQQLRQLRLQMLQYAQKVTIVYQKRKQQFDASMTELRTTVQRYCSEGDQLKEILQEQAGAQKNHFLRSHLIRDHVADIPGLTEGLIPMLESYGVESALDAHKLGIYGVPSLSPELAIELLQWRQLVEQEFKFKPDHGITAQDLERTQQLATQRFKMAQARKILIGAQHLDSLALVGKSTVRRSARDFDVLSQKWKHLARKKHATQQQRTKLERSLNASVTTVTTALIAMPIVGGLLALLLR